MVLGPPGGHVSLIGVHVKKRFLKKVTTVLSLNKTSNISQVGCGAHVQSDPGMKGEAWVLAADKNPTGCNWKEPPQGKRTWMGAGGIGEKLGGDESSRTVPWVSVLRKDQGIWSAAASVFDFIQTRLQSFLHPVHEFCLYLSSKDQLIYYWFSIFL